MVQTIRQQHGLSWRNGSEASVSGILQRTSPRALSRGKKSRLASSHEPVHCPTAVVRVPSCPLSCCPRCAIGRTAARYSVHDCCSVLAKSTFLRVRSLALLKKRCATEDWLITELFSFSRRSPSTFTLAHGARKRIEVAPNQAFYSASHVNRNPMLPFT